MKLQLFRPVKSSLGQAWIGTPLENHYNLATSGGKSVISQFFGESNLCVKDGQYAYKTNLRCPAGFVDLYNSLGLVGHNGIDLPTKLGEPIFASHDGIVNAVQSDQKFGNGIELVSREPFDYGSEQAFYKSRYWHLQSVVVKVGDKVDIGDLLGYADATGITTGGATGGNHLHFDLKPIQKQNGVWVNLETKNGMLGAIDPLPYIIEKDAITYKQELLNIQNALNKIAEMIKNLFSFFK